MRSRRGSSGFTLIELLIVVAIIGIIAAIAIPSLLRARVSAQEAAAIGDVRTVLSAEAAFHTAANGYGPISCLLTPSNGGCLAFYPLTAPTFLDEAVATLVAKSGYSRSFSPAPGTPTVGCPGCIGGYCYSATPTLAGQSGVRGFAGDQSARICQDPTGADLCGGISSLPAGCTILGN